MSGDKRLLRRIHQALRAGEPSWKVFVHKSDWLCPFCGEVVAEKLRMEEPFELRIAQHLGGSCPAYTGPEAVELDLETIEWRAEMLKLQRFVRKALARDPVWQLAADDGVWLCPFCATPTDLALEPLSAEGRSAADEEALEKSTRRVVRHLMQCRAYKEGDGLPKRLEVLLESREQHALDKRRADTKGLLTRDSRWRLRDMDHRWLCPFCAKVTDIVFERDAMPTDALAAQVEAHVYACSSYKKLGGEARDERFLKDRVIELNRRRILDKLRRKLGTHPIWQVTDNDDEWYCPYCASATGLKLPDPARHGVSDHTLSEVFAHLGSCAVYRGKRPQLQPKSIVLQHAARADRLKGLRREVRTAVLQDPRFSVHDAFGSWLCPYCRKVQKAISVSADRSLEGKTAEQLVGHLAEQCAAYKDGEAPAATKEELLALVRVEEEPRPSEPVETAAAEPPPTEADESDWARRIDREVALLKHEVEVSKELARSLEDARTRQLRLLPRLPELEGLDLGVVYEPCGRVGGDFYDFFRTGEHEWAIAVGDVSGHGIEAALLVGLAKKLVQVHARARGSPGQTLVLANADIYPDLDARTFVTAFFGVLDTATRTLRFARAGHNPLILFNPSRTPRLQVLDSKGMALGMDPGPVFLASLEEVELRLYPGDLLIQYTDGVTEATDHEGEEFGLPRLLAVIERYGREEAEYVLYKVERALNDFCEGARRRDDVTLVALKVVASETGGRP